MTGNFLLMGCWSVTEPRHDGGEVTRDGCCSPAEALGTVTRMLVGTSQRAVREDTARVAVVTDNRGETLG